MPILKQVRKDRRNKASCFLLNFSNNVTSQTGEDGIIAEIFARIGTQSRWCVEFGAWDGKKLSNTYDLVANRGWSGVLIEGSSDKYGELTKTYAGNASAICLNAIVAPQSGPDSLEDHLSRTLIPTEFDLLSIDIDGNDYHVWQSLSSYRPRVVVVEINPTVPNDVVFIQDRDIRINQGCSLSALIELGKQKGYELACATKLNGIFVLEPDYVKLGIKDNDIDSMYQSAHDGKYFSGYDGTLFHIGLSKLPWSGGTPIGPQDLQVLDAATRRYKDAVAAR